MIFIRDNASLDVHRLPFIRGLKVAVVYPHIEILTRDSRNILSDQVSLKQTIQQTGNLGGLIIGLYNGNLDLISRSIEDCIIEPQRAQLIPNFYKVKDAALSMGAMACSISGAGPSIFALCANSLNAENAGQAMQKVFMDNGIECNFFLSEINQEGVVLL